MLLSFVIVTYQRPALLERCLKSLNELSSDQLTYEIIVIINGNDPDAKKVLASFPNNIKLKILEHALTPAGARNQALPIAQGDYLIFLDDDVQVPKGYLSSLIPILAEHPILFGGPDISPPTASLFQKALGYAQQSPLTSAHTRYRHLEDKSLRRAVPDGNEFILCNMGIHRSIFTEHRLTFDERFKRNEENVLIHQIKALHQHFIFSPQLYVYHEKKQRLSSLSKAVFSSGLHRIKSFVLFPDSLSLIYFAPLLFMLYLCSLPWLWQLPLFLLPLQAYAIFLILFTWRLIQKHRLTSPVLILLISYLQVHITIAYGMGSFVGLATQLPRASSP